jgi:mRNA interferase MazF
MKTKTNGSDKILNIRRGDIYYADLSPVIGSEQGGLRPVLIIQNDIGNRYSPTVIAAAITSKLSKAKLPTHIDVYAEKVGLAKDSVILLEQIRTIDKKRLKEKMGHLEDDIMHEVNDAITVSFGLSAEPNVSGYTAMENPYISHPVYENQPSFEPVPSSYVAKADVPDTNPNMQTF